MKKALTLIELIVVIVVIGILAVIAIPKLSSSYLIAKESAAQSNLRIISAAIENYATVNSGNFPTDQDDLLPTSLGGTATPGYLNQSFCGGTVSGYTYSCSADALCGDCTLSATGYKVRATPSACGATGTKTFTIITGGVMSSTGC